jgi:ParB family chromosome partitioning protein
MGALMSDSKKKRMSMLDSLAAAGATPVAGSMMSSNRALRSARDAVDAHHVWELDPADIEDDRYSDRLDPKDVQDLRVSIEMNGQTVPILVRRHPAHDNRYLLVYGRRRLEAVRASDKVNKVRALIANLDDSAALRAQVSENTARRDLSYIERALFAQALLERGFGSQAQIADVLNATRSAVSMAVSVARAIGTDLATAIGPAHGIGRPRWEALAQALAESPVTVEELCRIASDAQAKAALQARDENALGEDASVAAFEAVARYVRKGARPDLGSQTHAKTPRATKSMLLIDGAQVGAIKRSGRALRLDLTDVDDAFAAWLDARAQDVLEELHDRWKRES